MTASICGFYNHCNYGDSLMRNELAKLFKNLQINSIFFSDTSGNEALNYKESNCLDSDLIVIGGGGIISKNFWFFKNNFDQKLLPNQELILLNVNLTKDSIEVLQKIKNKLSLIVVRDLFSFDLAEKSLEYKKRVLYAPDISLLNNNNYKQQNNFVSFCLNSYILNDFFKLEKRAKVFSEKCIIELSEFAKWLRAFDQKIQIVPSQISKEINDNRIGALLDGNIHGADKWLLSNLDIEQYLIQSNLIISMRYHTTLFAIKHGIPFIDISHHSKNIKFLEQCGLNDFSISYWDLSLNKLQETANKAKYSNKIKETSYHYSVSSCRHYWNLVEGQIKELL